MINLKELRPSGILTGAASDLPELLHNLLVRVQFVPSMRHYLGWRGMRPSSRFEHTWTFRIRGMRGVYGLVFGDLLAAEGWTIGKWDLCYFPNADDPLVDRLAVVTALITRQSEYSDAIREFMEHPQLVEAFRVGELVLAVADDQQSLAVGFCAPTRTRIVAGSDFIVSNGSEPYSVRAGSVEQDFPSYLAAARFFETLAATVSYVVEGAPAIVQRAIYPGQQLIRDGATLTKADSAGIRDIAVCLGYGGAEVQHVINSFARCGVAPVSSTSWSQQGPLPPYVAHQLWWNAYALDGIKRFDKRTLCIENRPQLFVVAGFLGSGKTSFLQSLLEYHLSRGRFVAVIQNELGELSLDGKLTQDAIAVAELTEGTVCCTLLGELRPALHEIVTNYQPDLIILEMSGAANPLGLAEDLLAIEEWIAFDSVTTIVDGENFLSSLREHEVVGDQVRAADLIVINKTDLVTPDALAELKHEISKLNRHAAITETHHGYVNPRLWYDTDVEANPDAEECCASGQHTGPPQLINGKHHHDTFSAVRVDCHVGVKIDDLIAKLSNVPPNIFRIKGVVKTDSGANVLVQFVGGRYDIAPFDSTRPVEPFLVLIGTDAENVAADFWRF